MKSHTASSARTTRIAAIVALIVGASAAFAQPPMSHDDIPKVAVSYSDLNLATAEGSTVLYRRLVAAARQVCPQTDDSLLAMRMNREAERCIADAVERAVQKIRNPKFVEVAASHSR
jgi:UrcA family protein